MKIRNKMKKLWVFFLAISSFSSFSQEETTLSKEKLYEAKKQLREGNKLYRTNRLEDATIAYQKSLAAEGTYYKGAYNLGNALFQQKKYKEAGEQYQLANKLAKKKEDKAKTNELIGDIFKKQKNLEKALASYKQALLKNPTDDILREKYVAAKKEKEKQDQQSEDNKEDQNQDNKEDKDKKNKDQENKNEEGDDKEDKEGDQDKQEKEDNQGNDKEDKENQKGQQNENKQEQPSPTKESKLSPEQIQQLLESMSNEEQKTQEKVNAQKVKVKKDNNEKDW